jgi:hypothetical protein
MESNSWAAGAHNNNFFSSWTPPLSSASSLLLLLFFFFNFSLNYPSPPLFFLSIIMVTYGKDGRSTQSVGRWKPGGLTPHTAPCKRTMPFLFVSLLTEFNFYERRRRRRRRRRRGR